MKKEVLCTDAVEWLTDTTKQFDGCVFTGIPDINDIPEFAKVKKTQGIVLRSIQYMEWFSGVAECIFNKLANGQYVIFSQTDMKVIDDHGHVISYIDKSNLCSVAATKCGCTLMWHKIVLSSDKEYIRHRSSCTHLLCFSKCATYHTSLFQTPDVIHRGEMIWPKAIGLDACILGISFLKYVAKTNKVINPFCGQGTILAVANYFGLNSFGIEISPKRARTALARDVSSLIDSIPLSRLRLLGACTLDTLDVNRDMIVDTSITDGAVAEDKCDVAAGADLCILRMQDDECECEDDSDVNDSDLISMFNNNVNDNCHKY